MVAIKIENLKKYFGKIKAVDGISIEVDKGAIFGFLGPNGAGKTTTIRCMMNFIYPREGSITILEKDARQDSGELKNSIGYLP
jgi:ABC-2 type transport system ATP-binding protein